MKRCVLYVFVAALGLIAFPPAPAGRAMAVSVSDPELPRTLLDTRFLPPSGAVINVPAGGDLQAAINNARPGDTIVLQAGATYTTPPDGFTLPNKTGTEWIVIRTSALNTLPAEGTRVSPANAAAMAQIVTTAVSPAVSTQPGAHHYRFIGIEFAEAAGLPLNYGLVVMGEAGGAQNSLSVVPHDLIIDRCYIHGNATGEVVRGVALNSARAAVIDSYISNIHSPYVDTQAVQGSNGPGPFKIVNNYLEASGENLMFGGGDPMISGLVPSDIEFRRNLCSKPLSWNPFDPSYAGIRWGVKNLFELKNVQRILIDGNIFENNWAAAQIGTAIVITPRNQDGTAPWSIVQDVTFTNNIVRHTASAMNILGWDNAQPSQQTLRLKIANNLFDDVGGPRWGGNGVLFYLLDGIAYVTFDHNTAFQTWSVVVADGRAHAGFVFTNNLVPHNTYGIVGSGASTGTSSLTTYFPGYVFAKNVLAGGTASNYPAGNFFPASLSQVGFVDLAGGDYHLSPSSPYKGAGTDGRDIGADIDALQAAINGSTPPPPPSATPTVSWMTPNAGSTTGGTSVTVTGSGFAAGAAVSFGGAAATGVSVTSSTTITATTPAHAAGGVSVVVTNADGQSGTLTNGFTFTSPPPASPSDVVLYAAEAPTRVGNYQVVADSSAAGGSRIWNPDAGAAKITAAAANPTTYFEMTFSAQAGLAYRLWMRGRAQSDFWGNDSAFVQFSDSLTSGGAPTFRIGTTSAAEYNLEDCSGCGISGWGWQDDGWGVGVLGPLIYFQTSGTHTLRVQVREDGLSLDQIVLSPSTYVNSSPGGLTNDTTILPKTGGSPPPGPAPPPAVSWMTPNAGSTTGGTSVTVTGSGFAAGAAVSFGGAAATGVSVTSSTTITATTPAHAAGGVSVVVTNADGQSGTLTNGFTYNAPSSAPTEIVLWAVDVPASSIAGNWSKITDVTAAGQTALWNPDAGAAKLPAPLASPTHYFEVTFTAQAGAAYRLWVRGKADNNSPYNDSFYVQFSDSLNSSGAVAFRIGTTDATVINLEDGLGVGLSGWGWQDNGWGAGVLGPLIYFQTSGTHTLRLQPREDGFAIDQIVLSPQTYLTNAPGALKNDNTILPRN